MGGPRPSGLGILVFNCVPEIFCPGSSPSVSEQEGNESYLEKFCPFMKEAERKKRKGPTLEVTAKTALVRSFPERKTLELKLELQSGVLSPPPNSQSDRSTCPESDQRRCVGRGLLSRPRPCPTLVGGASCCRPGGTGAPRGRPPQIPEVPSSPPRPVHDDPARRCGCLVDTDHSAERQK